MTTRDFIPIVRDSEELSELYNAQIELEIIKGDLFIKKDSLNALHDTTEVEIKAEINLTTTLQEVCRERQRDLQELAKITANAEQQRNYNIVRNLPYFVSKELFDEIEQSAKMPRSMFRDKIIKERGSLKKMAG